MTQTATPDLVPDWTMGDRLLKARRHAGLSVLDMAAAIDMDRHTVSAYEAGRSEPKRPMVAAWALRTGVSLDWLLHGDAGIPVPRDGHRDLSAPEHTHFGSEGWGFESLRVHRTADLPAHRTGRRRGDFVTPHPVYAAADAA